MTTGSVDVELLDGGVLVVVLNQPAKRNAISAAMMDQLSERLAAADDDPAVRVVVLRGAGEHFSSGGDLSQTAPQDATAENARLLLRRYQTAVRTLRRIATPVVAMADGYVVGGGFSLVLASDLVCVSDRVAVVPAFCAIGIVPEMGMLRTLPALVGEKAAKEILFTNRTLHADDLVRLGLANRVLPADELLAGTLELARTVAAMPALSIQASKEIMNAAADTGLDAVLAAESTASPFAAQSAEHHAAVRRFAR